MAAPEVAVRESAPGTLVVTGALTFDTAAQALEQAQPLLGDGRQARLDLSAVSHVDSAGMACVLNMMACAYRHGGHLEIMHVPAGLEALARVCEVAPLLAAA